ncbi:MAG: hypothetical protein KGK07_02835 [Chloroflexota bacterium]|nr:hypothetical protein [Chloroflexota bacterium]
MKRLLGSSIIALVASTVLAAAAAAQTPPAATPTPTTATQTPPAATAGSMVVTALAPVPAGTTVRLEAINGQTLRTVLCREAATVADPSSAAASRATFIVDPASCAGPPRLGDLRICWGATECQIFRFEPGKSVDLGLLTTFVVQHPPSVGGGFGAPASGPDRLGRWLRWGAGTLFVLGVAGLLASGVLLRRRRPSGR